MELELCNKAQQKHTPGVQGMSVILPEPMLLVALLQYRQDKPRCCQPWAQPHRLMLEGYLTYATSLAEVMLPPQISKSMRRAGSQNKRIAMEA